MQTEVKFEAIKSKAKQLISGAAADRAGVASTITGWLNDAAFQALARMACDMDQYLSVERPALVEFAKNFNIKPGATRSDYLAAHAKGIAGRDFILGKTASELALAALKAREEAFGIIDKWDVRCVAKLIDLFPEIVPKRLLRASISCYMADDEDSTWMVCFDTAAPRLVA